MWCVPELDAEYIDRMEAILRLYARPLSPRKPVVCLDEKPVVLRSDKRKRCIARNGMRRYDYEYQRCGTANLFVMVEPKAGRHFAKVTQTRNRFEFARVLRDIARRYPSAETIHLVVDNLSTHTKRALADTFGSATADDLWSRFIVHYTPKHGSWLNQAEIAISMISRECIGRLRFSTHADLRRQVQTWVRTANRRERKINWKFRTADARHKFGYCGRQKTAS